MYDVSKLINICRWDIVLTKTGRYQHRLPTSTLLPLHQLPQRRSTMYMLEMKIKQDWLGQHSAGWSADAPIIHRMAEG